MWLHRKYDSYRNLAIVTFGENFNILTASYQFPIIDPNDPEENNMDFRNFVSFKDKTPEEAEKLYEEMQKANPDDDIGPYLLKEEGIEVESTVDNKENKKDSYAEPSDIKEIYYKDDINDDLDLDREDGEIDHDEEEIFSESRINEILGEMKKRKAKPKGSLVPINVASSKKLTQNKMESNTPLEFKKAQLKGVGTEKKKKK